MILFLHALSSAQPTLSTQTIRDILYQAHPQQTVSYEDHLGEGPRHFDSDPRSNWNLVNCTTWWQHVIAKGYAKTDAQEQQVLDQLRHYFGEVSFGTRKHFLDRNLSLDPTPFVDIHSLDIPLCEADKMQTVHLELPKFRSWKQYECPLYREEITEISFQYMSPQQTKRCAGVLPSGIYVMFPVATPQYLDVWGKESGPMGRVHGFILDKEGTQAQLYHASLDKGKIATESLESYVQSKSAQLFAGYNIFALQAQFRRDPKYAYNPNDVRKIQHCELKKYSHF